jgi:hypothetical protein
MRLVPLLLITATTLVVPISSEAQTDPLGRKVYQIKPPPADTASTGIQQVGRIARPPQTVTTASTPAPLSGCAVAPTIAQAGTAGCAAPAQSGTATAASRQPPDNYQRLRMGKIDFAPEPDPRVNQAIKAAIVSGGVKATKPPAAQQAQRLRGSNGSPAPNAPH